MKTYKLQDQVIVRRRIRTTPATNEIKVGSILAFADDGNSAIVSLPGPGGKIQRVTVPVESLQPASEHFKRSRVQVNPTFRQIQ